MKKEKLKKVVTQIYEAGYYNGKIGRDKDNFNINKAIEEIEIALNITSDSKRGPEKKEKIQLHNWSEYKTDYEDGMICGLTCGCSDQECKF